jgi:hypothetical protein
MLVPVADILLIERRRCKCCDKTYDAPGIFIHRLESSPEGELSKRVMHARREIGHEKGADPFVPYRAVRLFEVSVPHCLACWNTNISWQNANAIIPERPEYERSWKTIIGSLPRKLPKKLRPLPDTISTKDL